VYETFPAGRRECDRWVVFLHGGGFINEIVKAHWRLIGYLTREAGVRCVVPIYPLAPQATAGEIVPVAGALMREVLAQAGDAKVTLMGNSAGANLALAAAQWLRDKGARQPRRLVLISPGLDASLSRSEHIAAAAADPMQAIPGILESGRMYAGTLDVTHPYVSPLNGKMDGLAPMVVFSGTADLLHPDSIELARRARAAGVAVELHLRQGQPHNYAGFPTPEGREALRVIVAKLHET
jgi:acetyl esterase/lipase